MLVVLVTFMFTAVFEIVFVLKFGVELLLPIHYHTVQTYPFYFGTYGRLPVPGSKQAYSIKFQNFVTKISIAFFFFLKSQQVTFHYSLFVYFPVNLYK